MHKDPLSELVAALQRLPGIGAKSAHRLAFHILKTPREDAERLCDAIRDVKERVTYCSICNNITDADPCGFCTGTTRDQLAGAQAVVPTITGRAWLTGTAQYFLDPDDPFPAGFEL